MSQVYLDQQDRPDQEDKQVLQDKKVNQEREACLDYQGKLADLGKQDNLVLEERPDPWVQLDHRDQEVNLVQLEHQVEENRAQEVNLDCLVLQVGQVKEDSREHLEHLVPKVPPDRVENPVCQDHKDYEENLDHKAQQVKPEYFSN